MGFKNISYSRSVEGVNNLGLRSWRKFGAEYELVDGEDKNAATQALKDFVHDNIKQQTQVEQVKQVQKEEPGTIEQKTIQQIEQCTDLKVLESFKILAQKNEKIKSAYNKQLELLTKK